MAQFVIGATLDKEKALGIYAHRVKTIRADLWYLPGFVSFQYGELRDNNNFHRSIKVTLARYGIAEIWGIDTPETPQKHPLRKGKGKGQGKGEVQGEGMGEGAAKLAKLYIKPDPAKEPIAALVMHFKILSGAAWNDRDWDTRFWGRLTGEAKVILEKIGGFNDAISFIDYHAKKLTDAKCKWNLRTIADRAVEYKAKERARYDAASLKGFRRTDAEAGADKQAGEVGELSTVGPVPDAVRDSERVQPEHPKDH